MNLVARVLRVAKVVLAMPARIMRGAPARPLSAPWGKPTLAGAIRHGYESDGTKRMAVSMSTSVPTVSQRPFASIDSGVTVSEAAVSLMP